MTPLQILFHQPVRRFGDILHHRISRHHLFNLWIFLVFVIKSGIEAKHLPNVKIIKNLLLENRVNETSQKNRNHDTTSLRFRNEKIPTNYNLNGNLPPNDDHFDQFLELNISFMPKFQNVPIINERIVSKSK